MPDPKKVTAVTEIKPPTTKEELQRFLGMTTYLSKFIPNYSETSAPLRTLLEKDHRMALGSEHFYFYLHIVLLAGLIDVYNKQQQSWTYSLLPQMNVESSLVSHPS